MPDISLNPYSYRDKAAIIERARLRGLATEAREARQELALATVDLVHALNCLIDAGLPKADALDAAAGLRDAISDADWKHCLTLDEAGEMYAEVDLSELDAVIEECRK
jgi:hypothetical protein